MPAGGALVRELLTREAAAWELLALPSEYESAVCEMLDRLRQAAPPAQYGPALVTLTSAVLRRTGVTLTESRACAAQHLLGLAVSSRDQAVLGRARVLILLAWLQLGSVVAAGPEVMSIAPDLPDGVVLPNGADPSAIADPTLRKQAVDAADEHARAAERWNAKQRALGHLRTLTALVQSLPSGPADEVDATHELNAAMALAPGIPPELRRVLDSNVN